MTVREINIALRVPTRSRLNLERDLVLTFQEDHGQLVWFNDGPEHDLGGSHICNFGLDQTEKS